MYTGQSVVYTGQSVVYTGQSVVYTGQSVVYTGQSVVYTGRGRSLFSSTAPQPTTRYLVLSKNETDSS